MTEADMYKKMYSILCGALSDALDLLEEGRVFELRQELTDALDWAEEIYINSGLT